MVVKVGPGSEEAIWTLVANGQTNIDVLRTQVEWGSKPFEDPIKDVPVVRPQRWTRADGPPSVRHPGRDLPVLRSLAIGN